MNMTRLSVAFIACLPFGGTLSLLRGQSPSPSVDQQLHSQYRVASVDGNGRVVRPGSVLVVAQDGIKANPPSRAGCWYNSHKPGDRIKYSTLFEVTVPADLRNQVRLLQVGEKVMVISLVVKSEVTFCVQTYTGNPDDPPYRAGLVFQFPQKNYVQPANLKAIQDSITEVFSIDTSTSSEPSMPAPGEQQGKTNAGQGGQTASVVGLYVAPGGRQLQLNPDGSFSARGAGSPTTAGHFAVNGDALVLTFPADGRSSTLRIHDDKIYYASGQVAVRQSDLTAPAIAPLRLPSTYVSAQTPADQIQLNADNSFSLQEAGQTYTGTFAADGGALKLNISGGAVTTATLQGNNLIDASGQTWVREQSAGAASAGAALKNDDIIKMAKAGFDDAIIVAKIGSSKCQFDTSTDSLIQLKQSGVSAAVLKAMVGAGK